MAILVHNRNPLLIHLPRLLADRIWDTPKNDSHVDNGSRELTHILACLPPIALEYRTLDLYNSWFGVVNCNLMLPEVGRKVKRIIQFQRWILHLP